MLAVGGLFVVAEVALLGAWGALPARALDLPIRIDPISTLLEQYGYDPGYPLNIPSFDARNRPFVRTRTASQDLTRSVFDLGDDSRWVSAS